MVVVGGGSWGGVNNGHFLQIFGMRYKLSQSLSHFVVNPPAFCGRIFKQYICASTFLFPTHRKTSVFLRPFHPLIQTGRTKQVVIRTLAGV